MSTAVVTASGPASGTPTLFSHFTVVNTYTGTPSGVAFDSQNNRYVVFNNGPRDHGPTNVLEYSAADPSYAINFASDGGRSSGIAFNATLNSLVEVQPTNIAGQTVFTVASNSVSDFAAVDNATGVTVDSSGNLFVATGADGSIIEFPHDGGSRTVVSDLANPTALLSTIPGKLLVGDCAAGRSGGKVVEVTIATGQEHTLSRSMVCPDGLAIAPSGALLVSDYGTGIVYRQSMTGSFVAIASGLVRPQGIAFDSTGNLYIANSGARTIVEIPVATFASELAISHRVATVTARSLRVSWVNSAFTNQVTCSLFRQNGSTLTPLRAKTLTTPVCTFINLSTSTKYAVRILATDGTMNALGSWISLTTRKK